MSAAAAGRPGARAQARARAQHRPAVVLVGPPGAGKSTVAASLAARLAVDVRDTDADVEAATGTSISDLFLSDGEAAFRALERAAVALALAEHRGVLALGGGAPVDEATRELLAGHTVVFLDVSLAAAARRIGLDAPRPLLLDSPRATWTRLMTARRPVYESVASLVVDTTELDPETVVDRIVRAFGLLDADEGTEPGEPDRRDERTAPDGRHEGHEGDEGTEHGGPA